MQEYQISHSPEETENIAGRFAQSLQPGDTVALSGELGAGKTAFVRGVLRGLGYEGRVTSPTFTIANEYETAKGPVVHCDLYRIMDAEALYDLGFDAYLDGQHILLVEWSENAPDILPPSFWRVQLAYGDGEDMRQITIGEETL